MYIQHKRVRLEQSKDEGGEKKTLTETVVFSQRVDATGQGTLPAPYQSKNQMKYQSYLNSIVLEEEYSAVFLN